MTRSPHFPPPAEILMARELLRPPSLPNPFAALSIPDLFADNQLSPSKRTLFNACVISPLQPHFWHPERNIPRQ
jgi:hypothetical protein